MKTLKDLANDIMNVVDKHNIPVQAKVLLDQIAYALQDYGKTPKFVFIPRKNADNVEGRGPRVSVGIAFTNEDVAHQFIADKPGVMGFPGVKGGWDVTNVEVVETVEEGNEISHQLNRG